MNTTSASTTMPYTNLLVAHTFEVCLRVNELLQAQHPAQAAALIEKLVFAPIYRLFKRLRGHLYPTAGSRQLGDPAV